MDMKLFASEIEKCRHDLPVGSVVTDNKTGLKIAAKDGFIHLTQVQQAGKKSMPIEDFLRGTQLVGRWNANN